MSLNNRMGNPDSDPKCLCRWGGRPPWLVATQKTRSCCFSWPCSLLAQTCSQLIQPYKKLIQPKKPKGRVRCCRRGFSQFKPMPTKARVGPCCLLFGTWRSRGGWRAHTANLALGASWLQAQLCHRERCSRRVKAPWDPVLNTWGWEGTAKAKGRQHSSA